jgi:hypothetical protein
MPCVIRHTVDGTNEFHAELMPGEWRLKPQIEALEAWLGEHAEQMDPLSGWSADIGFGHRLDAGGGGALISQDLMRLCLRTKLELYLSEYPVQIPAKE